MRVPEPDIKPVCPHSRGPLPDCPGDREVVLWDPGEFRDPETGRDLWSCLACGNDFVS